MESDVRDLRLRTGIRVPCLVQGDADAKPVLLLHAWGESRRSFDRLIPLLTGFRLYAPDLRGQGEADKPADGYSLAEQAEDAAAILDALNVPGPSSSAPPAAATSPNSWPLSTRSASRPWCWWALP